VTADSIFILVTGAIAALLGLGALVAALRPARTTSDGAPAPIGMADSAGMPADKYEADTAGQAALVGEAQGTAVRILWWVSIAAVLIGVGLSNAFDATQSGIYIVGAAAVGVVVLLHDLIPPRFRRGPLVAVEVLAALGLTTALLTLTGYGTSPFVFGYHLVAVAVALALGGPMALSVAALATFAFLGVLALDPDIATYAGADLLRFGLTIGSAWLLAYIAGVYASGERRMRDTVLQMSRTDSLTGLFNRGQLFPTLEQEVQRTRRSSRGFCLLMVDLDGLKAVNDSYGHHRGDEVLRLLGGVIRRSIRATDTAYRYGGDEFLVLLPETDFAGAFVVAEKVRAGAEELGIMAGGGELLTSVSIGLVSCPEDGTSSEELMIAADRAMYQAKSLGKNQISGNPRPRRLPYHPAEEAAAEVEAAPSAARPTVASDSRMPSPPSVPPAASRAASAPATFEGELPPFLEPGRAAFPVDLEPAAVSDGTDPLPLESAEDEETDASEVRRNIASARLHMDPDHQIRRAMDAFLSPTPRSSGDRPERVRTR
jgi:diguanylate cyclase (GGDEF)-like protein